MSEHHRLASLSRCNRLPAFNAGWYVEIASTKVIIPTGSQPVSTS
jgi:hypothetical protein